MPETALEKAKRKFEQAKAALDAIKAREATAERKKDTRRKIVLGGALLELSKTDKDASALVTRLIAGLTREQDKRIFEKGSEKDARKEPPPVPVKSETAPAPAEKSSMQGPASPTPAIPRPIPPMPKPSPPNFAPKSTPDETDSVPRASSFPVRPDREKI